MGSGSVAGASSLGGLTGTDLLNAAGGVSYVVPDPRPYDAVFRTTVKLTLNDDGPFVINQPALIGPDGANGGVTSSTGGATSASDAKIGPA